MSQLTLLPRVQRVNQRPPQAVVDCIAGHVYSVELFKAPNRDTDHASGLSWFLEWHPAINNNIKCGTGPALAGSHDVQHTTDPPNLPPGVQKPIGYPEFLVDLAAFFAPSRGQLFIVGSSQPSLPDEGFFAFSHRPLLPFENPPPWTFTYPEGGRDVGAGTRPVPVPRGAVSVTCPISGVNLSIKYGPTTTVIVPTTAGQAIPCMGALSVEPNVITPMQFRLQL